MEDSIDRFSNEILISLDQNWEAFLLNLPKIVFALVVFAVSIFLATKVSRFMLHRLNSKARDPLFTSFIAQVTKYALIIMGLMICLQIADLSGIAGGLLAGAGVSALIIGFAFKDIGENFLAGIILAFDRPFHLDDTILIEGFMGNVKALNFRTTHIKTFDEKDVFIPNSVIVKQALTNLTRDGRLRIDFTVGVAYEDNANRAIQLGVTTIKNCTGILPEPQPFGAIETFSASTVDIKFYFWTSTDDYRRGVLILKSDIMEEVKAALLGSGFTLPSNIQELKLYDKRAAFPIQVLPSGPALADGGAPNKT